MKSAARIRASQGVVALMVAVLFGCCVIASAAAPVALSLSRSITLAVAQSAQVRLAEMSVVEAQRALDRVSVDQLLAGNRQSVQTAADSLFLAKMGVAMARDDVAAKVEQSYFAAIVSDEVADMRRVALATAKRQLATGKVKLQAGLATKADVEALEDSAVAAQYAVDAAMRSQRSAMLRFNRNMGWDLETKVKLNDKLEFAPIKVDLKAALVSAQTNRRDLIQARTSLQRKRESLALASNDFTPAADKEQLQMDIDRAVIDLDQALKDAAIAVEESFSSLLGSQNEVDIRTRSLSRAKRHVANVELNFKNGIARASDLVNAQANYENAQLQRLQGVNDYRAALSGFYRTIGKERPGLAANAGK